MIIWLNNFPEELSNTWYAVRALKLACGATFSLLPHREEDYKLIFSVIPHRWIVWVSFCWRQESQNWTHDVGAIESSIHLTSRTGASKELSNYCTINGCSPSGWLAGNEVWTTFPIAIDTIYPTWLVTLHIPWTATSWGYRKKTSRLTMNRIKYSLYS